MARVQLENSDRPNGYREVAMVLGVENAVVHKVNPRFEDQADPIVIGHIPKIQTGTSMRVLFDEGYGQPKNQKKDTSRVMHIYVLNDGTISVHTLSGGIYRIRGTLTGKITEMEEAQEQKDTPEAQANEIHQSEGVASQQKNTLWNLWGLLKKKE